MQKLLVYTHLWVLPPNLQSFRILGIECCFSVLMSKNTYNSNVMLGRSSSNRLWDWEKILPWGEYTFTEILPESPTKKYVLSEVIALGSVLVWPVEIFSTQSKSYWITGEAWFAVPTGFRRFSWWCHLHLSPECLYRCKRPPAGP